MRNALHFLLASAAITLAVASTPSFAATIDFSATNGTYSNKYVYNGADFSSYTESGFNVAETSGDANIGLTYTFYPSFSSNYFLYAQNGSVTVTASNGGDFTFTGVDLADPPPSEQYSITGYLDSSQIFTTSGSLTDDWALYGTGFSSDTINSLVISLNTPSCKNPYQCFNYTYGSVDNIGVNAATDPSPAPEPSSLLLLATGLVGAAGVIRRRLPA